MALQSQIRLTTSPINRQKFDEAAEFGPGERRPAALSKRTNRPRWTFRDAVYRVKVSSDGDHIAGLSRLKRIDVHG